MSAAEKMFQAAPVAPPRPYPTVQALMELGTAWTTLKLSDGAMRTAAEHRLTLAVKALEVLGDYAGPCPTRVLVWARGAAKLWLEATAERRVIGKKLSRAVDANIDLALAYCADTLDDDPSSPVQPLTGRDRAAGERE